ncbi:MAG TPA: DUF6691 family protein [bacterium]|nr:DUF6691 family protein [bacterium]
MRNAFAFACGLVFAIGLGVGGMTQPAKIVGFLDVSGHWDPTLVFVLAGAVGSYMLAYRWIRRKRHPVFAMRFQIPRTSVIDTRLVLGSAIFGVGWGIGGFCPGPAITSFASGQMAPVVVALSMLAGVALFDLTPLGALPLGARWQPGKARESAPGAAASAPTDA